MPFRKKTWFLKIEQIKCKLISVKKIFLNSNIYFIGVDCPMGDSGPRSVLTLSYKGQYTSVHV
jgi:hypothetical protein